MSKKMLIDATHQEETRVAVVDGGRLAEFEYESAFRKPLKGNIYLAKVTRVEPSLQAAFVNYGGNRHGFLPFSEIHPDYFRIPVADREALIAEQEEELREHDEAEDEDVDTAGDESGVEEAEEVEEIIEEVGGDTPDENNEDEDEINGNVLTEDEVDDAIGNVAEDEAEDDEKNNGNRRGGRGGRGRGGRGRNNGRSNSRGGRGGKGGRYAAQRSKRVETVGGEEGDDQRFRFSLRRKYKIQEVIKRGQIMLIQVSKEERGNKGAAVSSYLSLPGRYCVLMPNSPRAGGVSRKISNYKDRAKMRDMMKELEVPKGMSVILRTAGVTRTKTEVKRDLDYLMRLWDTIRQLTLESSAPALVYEEADLVKRAVRDLYARDIDEILVSGEEGFKTAKTFMKMMIPSHAKRVVEYKESDHTLFNKYKIEEQIADIGETTVTLKSGGYLIINPTEALVSIDVNSGKATKERHIEETALKTNLEAAEEVARQLRLRDLGGLVVIDFIDMEDRRNNAKVERKMRDALSTDKARIQMGRISSFGLMEMSRQRMSASLGESQFETCKHCEGSGRTRTADAASILVLRDIETEGVKGRAAEVMVHVSTPVALYILNNKRQNMADLEARYDFKICIRVDDDLGASGSRVEVSKPKTKGDDTEDDSGEGEENQSRSHKPRENNNDGDDDNRQGGRRRGRRGGRRRNNRNRDDEGHDSRKSSADEPEDNKDDHKSKDESGDQSNEKSDDQKDEKPKRTRKSAAKKDDKEESKSDDTDQKDEKPKSGRKPAAKKADKDEVKEKAPEKDTKKDTKKEASKEPEDKPKRARKSPAKKPEPSNDDKSAAPKEYETVNEAPKKKKKGWWSKP